MLMVQGENWEFIYLFNPSVKLTMWQALSSVLEHWAWHIILVVLYRRMTVPCGDFFCEIKNTRNTLHLSTDDGSESSWPAWGSEAVSQDAQVSCCLFSDLATSRVYLESLSLRHVVDRFENLPSKYTNVHKHRTFWVRFLGLYEIFF